MFAKNSPLNKKEATVVEVIKYLKANLLQTKWEPTNTLKEINNDSHECTLAFKVINEKLSSFIQQLAAKSIQKQQQPERLGAVKMARSIEDQKMNRDKLTVTYGQQVQFYEQELFRLDQYFQKLSTSNYEGYLTSEISATKSRNHEFTKEISENKLKIGGMMAKKEKQLADSRVDRNEEVFRLNYLEAKIKRTVSKNESKDAFYGQLELENAKLGQKITVLQGSENLTTLNAEIGHSEKVRTLKQQSEKLKKGIEQTEERTKKSLMNLQLENEKLACENQLFKKNIAALSQTIEEQQKVIKTEEDKIGLSISHLKEFILRERTLTRDKRNKSPSECETENSNKKKRNKNGLASNLKIKRVVYSVDKANISSAIRRPLNVLENGESIAK